VKKTQYSYPEGQMCWLTTTKGRERPEKKMFSGWSSGADSLKECLRGRTVRFPILIYYFTAKRDSI
jgi:hypothetical protein